MFQYDGRLEHILHPDDYCEEAFFREEQRKLFTGAWQFAAVFEDLERPDSYLACEIQGKPILLRNIDGEIHAFEDICAHRHTLLVPPGRGRSDTIRCQYHGWEYRPSGLLGKLPDGRSFRGLRADNICLRKYRVETLGPLDFVNLTDQGDGLLEGLGTFSRELEKYYGNHKVVWRWTTVKWTPRSRQHSLDLRYSPR